MALTEPPDLRDARALCSVSLREEVTASMWGVPISFVLSWTGVSKRFLKGPDNEHLISFLAIQFLL